MLNDVTRASARERQQTLGAWCENAQDSLVEPKDYLREAFKQTWTHGTTQDKNEGIWMGHKERQEQSRLKMFDLNKRQKEKSEMIYYNWLWYFHLIIKIIIKLIK